MKRFLTTALILSAISPFGLVGCAEKEKVEQKETVTTPGGTTETTKSTEVKSSGENPPASTTGEKVEAPK